MENFVTIKAESRNEVGKKIAKKLRREGKIPAIIYGEKKDSIPISLDLSDIKMIKNSEAGKNSIIKFQRDDIEVNAMLKEIQYNPVSDEILHADFLRISLNKPVIVNVPVAVIGEAIGVKVEGGVLDFMTREIRLKCLPTQIPKEIELDVSELHSGRTLKVKDIIFDDEVKVLSDFNSVICGVSIVGGVDDEEEEGEGEGEEAPAETAEEPAKEA
jgi:large subunit ribosomal protein L25